jgi:ribbon-helix-helix CopG family protein
MATNNGVAEHREGDPLMARKRMSQDDEERLIAEAESRKDDGEFWNLDEPRRINRGPEPTAVLSVRMPLSQIQAIRELAAERRVSLGELMRDALNVFAGLSAPTVVTSRTVTRLSVAGAGFPPSETAQGETTSTEQPMSLTA